MTEAEAKTWIAHNVSRETSRNLVRLVEIVTREAVAQNLIAASTIDQIWARHIVDSVQLSPIIEDGGILDIGSGAGFPGLVIAMMRGNRVTLSEPRRRRAEFLARTAEALGLANVSVSQKRVEMIAGATFPIVMARAVAPLAALFAMAEHLTDAGTRWVLPKGRSAQSELADARETWHGDFRLVESVTDPHAAIIVATDVRRRAKRGSGR